MSRKKIDLILNTGNSYTFEQMNNDSFDKFPKIN